MNRKYPDAYPGESEAEYLNRKLEEEAKEERNSEASMGLFSMLAVFFLFLLKIAAIFGVFIYAGYLLSQKMLGDGADKLKIWGFALFFTYLIFGIIYFLKGIVVGLRQREKKLWILPWLICVLLCCAFPAFFIRSAFSGMFNPAQQKEIWYTIISWGVFGISLVYIYNIYQFKTPSAPQIIYWSYRLGLKISG